MHQNVNGWTLSNKLLRENVIYNLSPDIICINETHAVSKIHVNDYKIIQHNRPRSKNFTRGYGGVMIGIKHSFLEGKILEVISKQFEGVLSKVLNTLMEMKL